MKEKNIVKYSSNNLPEVTKEEIQRFKKIKEEEIDFSDIPELDENWFKSAKIVYPKKKRTVSVPVESEVLEWFKTHAQGKKYQILMSAVLKAFVQSQKEKELEKVNQ